MHKILFTIQWYQIDSRISRSANTLCDENVIRELMKYSSYEVHTLSYGVDGYPLEDINDGVHIHRFKRSWLWRQFINSFAEPNKKAYSFWSRINRILMRIKQFMTIPFYPIYEPFHVLNFAREAYKLHKKEHFDMIVSVHNGSDSLYPGYYIKKRCPSIKFVAICWDSIAGSNLAKYLPKSYSQFKKKQFERKIANLSDAMIVMEASRNYHYNNPIASEYFDKMIFLDVPYFCPVSNSEEKTVQVVGSPLKVMFSGNMVDRDPSYLYQLFDKYPTSVEFTFVCNVNYHKKIYDLAKGFTNVSVKCLPYMNHNDLVKLQLANDILINFGVTNPCAISGKIFDYMSTGKAIISTTTIDNEACIKYLNKYPRGLIIDERLSIERNLKILKDFIGMIGVNQCSFADINEMFYASKPEAYKVVLERIIEGYNGE